MEDEFKGLRPVVSQPEHDFGLLMGRVLSPARPLQSEEFLRGRAEQLHSIKRALYQPGRHVLIHGLRGVGKSSLAQTAAFQLSDGRDPIIVSCDEKSTFSSVIRDIFDCAEAAHPRLTEKIKEVSGGFSKFGLSASGKVAMRYDQKSDTGSLSEAVRLLEFICKEMDARPVIVVDEFDLLGESDEQEAFAHFAKQLSDRHVEAKLIICGIAESAEKLMSAHGSVDRYFHTVGLGKLPWEARFEIVTQAAKSLGVEVDDTSVIRIAMISDGFPHYVHFISEKMFWRVYEAKNGGKSTGEVFEMAMSDAAEAMDMKLRKPYETATKKYRNDYEHVLWAAADGHEFHRRSADIFASYERIMGRTEEEPLDRTKFNQRLNALKKESHASILIGTRQGWYEFREKMLRGYVRLKAEQAKVRLYGDHPNIINSTRWRDIPL